MRVGNQTVKTKHYFRGKRIAKRGLICYESGRMEDLVKITVTPATRSSVTLMSETISITALVYSHTSMQLLSRVSVT
jgi:hypothetical protein